MPDILSEKVAEMAAASVKTDMQYNFISKNSGLQVSSICYGAMTFGKGMEVIGNIERPLVLSRPFLLS